MALAVQKLKRAADLRFAYHTGVWKRQLAVEQQRLPLAAISSIRASSTLKPSAGVRYDPGNLLDGRAKTAWVEGVQDDGVGEWIEVTFRPGVELYGVAMLNGYGQSEKTFKENGRVSAVEVTLQDRDRSRSSSLEKHSLDRGNFAESSPNLPSAFLVDILSDQWVPGKEAYNPKKLRLRIIKAHRGSAYADTAISELYLLGTFKPG